MIFSAFIKTVTFLNRVRERPSTFLSPFAFFHFCFHRFLAVLFSRNLHVQRMFARRRNLLRAFETLDPDGSGQIDPAELR